MPTHDEHDECYLCYSASDRWELAGVITKDGLTVLDLRDVLDSGFGVHLTLADLKHLQSVLLEAIASKEPLK